MYMKANFEHFNGGHFELSLALCVFICNVIVPNCLMENCDGSQHFYGKY